MIIWSALAVLLLGIGMFEYVSTALAVPNVRNSQLKLFSYTVSNGKLIANAEATDNTIMSLTQNDPTKLTAIVYLDGDIVDSSMVSATAARSMTGTLNLQFASSATLVPMDYTPLHSVNNATPASGGGSEEPSGT